MVPTMDPEDVLSEYSKALKVGKPHRADVKPLYGSTGKIIDFYVEATHLGTLEFLDVYEFTNFQLDNRWIFENPTSEEPI
jgi:hypothetical protein